MNMMIFMFESCKIYNSSMEKAAPLISIDIPTSTIMGIKQWRIPQTQCTTGIDADISPYSGTRITHFSAIEHKSLKPIASWTPEANPVRRVLKFKQQWALDSLRFQTSDRLHMDSAGGVTIISLISYYQPFLRDAVFLSRTATQSTGQEH
jgi:hypothetical protein